MVKVKFNINSDKINKMIGPGSYPTSPKNASKLGTIGHANRKTYAV